MTYAKLAFAGILYTFFLLIYPFTFNFEIDINYSNYVLLYALLGVLFYLLFSLLQKVKLSFDAVIYYSILLAIVAFKTCVSHSLMSNEHLSIVLSILLISGIFLKSGDLSIKKAWLVIFILYLLELCIGIVQLLDGDNTPASITGSLKNSGIYVMYLSLHLPVCFYFLSELLKNKKHWLLPAYSLLLCATIVIGYVNQSRTSLLAILISIVALLAPVAKKAYHSKPKSTISKILAGLVVLGFVIAAGFYIMYLSSLKQASTNGRLLMLTVTKDHLLDDFWFGVGIGKFSYFYPQWQAHYFMQLNDIVTNPYFMSAGESYIVFNIYLLLFKEIGIIGFICFSACLYYFFKTQEVNDTKFCYAIKVTMSIVLFLGFTSYPLHTTPILFIFTLCLSTALWWRHKKNPVSVFPSMKGKFVLIPVLLAVAASFSSFQDALATLKWERLRQSNADYVQKTEDYARLWPFLKKNGKFLVNYGEVLLQDPASAKQAVEKLEQSKEYVTFYRNYYATAAAYKSIGKFKEAIANYNFLTHYIPSKFAPRYELALMYLRSGDTAMAKALAQRIIAMPVKIPSPEVDNIRANAKRILNYP